MNKRIVFAVIGLGLLITLSLTLSFQINSRAVAQGQAGPSTGGFTIPVPGQVSSGENPARTVPNNNNQTNGEGVVSPNASPSSQISYQGKLLQNGSPFNGNIAITFSLYLDQTGGSSIWTETQTVAVQNGLFNVMLGAVTPMTWLGNNFPSQLWLGIQPAGAASELTPREPLGAVGYAFNILPGATMVDLNDPEDYMYAFWVYSQNHLGIYGSSAYTNGVGITGESYGVSSGGGYPIGVQGYAPSYNGGVGVQGEGAYGVEGIGNIGVLGKPTNEWGTGVFGYGTYTNTIGVFGSTDQAGKYGHGVYAANTTSYSDSCSYSDDRCTSGLFAYGSNEAYASVIYSNGRSAILGIQEGSYYGMFLNNQEAPDGYGIWTNGESSFNDYVTFSAGKSGYVVDIALNDGDVALEKGDIVAISGYDAPVVGNVPVIRVQKATPENASGLVGVVDVLYVPCDIQDALPVGQGCGGFDPSVTTILPGQYLAVVTLGAYETVKVDATNGPIMPGDLLSISLTTGIAAKAEMITIEGVSFYAPGAIIGKALGSLESGLGFIPIFVTIK